MSYAPPYRINPAILSLVAEIAAEVGRLGALAGSGSVPKLRRENRIRSIHASLAIENNTLTLDQVTSVIAGKRVLGPQREIQEVKNAFAAYEAMPSWKPTALKDLLAAHRLMLEGLVDEAGKFRTRSVGIAKGKRIVHLAPPADRVPGLMKDLLGWLKRTDAHPLIAGCVFHYELEFIHPFADGNGRIGIWACELSSLLEHLEQGGHELVKFGELRTIHNFVAAERSGYQRNTESTIEIPARPNLNINHTANFFPETHSLFQTHRKKPSPHP
jgi:Fic family protein